MYINMVLDMDLSPVLAERNLTYDDVDCVIVDEVHEDGMLDLVVVLNRVVRERIPTFRHNSVTVFFKGWLSMYE